MLKIAKFYKWPTLLDVGATRGLIDVGTPRALMDVGTPRALIVPTPATPCVLTDRALNAAAGGATPKIAVGITALSVKFKEPSDGDERRVAA